VELQDISGYDTISEIEREPAECCGYFAEIPGRFSPGAVIVREFVGSNYCAQSQERVTCYNLKFSCARSQAPVTAYSKVAALNWGWI
jgi:hypothetical protein